MSYHADANDLPSLLNAEREECEGLLLSQGLDAYLLPVGEKVETQAEGVKQRLNEIAKAKLRMQAAAAKLASQPARYQAWLDETEAWSDEASHIDASADYANHVNSSTKLLRIIETKTETLAIEKANLEGYLTFIGKRITSRNESRGSNETDRPAMNRSPLDAGRAYARSHKLPDKRSSTFKHQGQDTGNVALAMMAGSLPPIQLPTYCGDPAGWSTFIDLFDAAVDSAPIASIQKLTILLGCLDGEAREAVDGFSVTGAHYPIVKDILTERFGDKRYILRTLMAQLMTLPMAAKDLRSVRHLQNQIERICRLLHSQGVDIDNEHVLLTIESKLPKYLLREAYTFRAQDPDAYNTVTLRKFLAQRIKIMEDCERVSGCFEPVRPEPSVNPLRIPVLRESHAGADDGAEKSGPICRFCSARHWTTDCPKFPDRESRLGKCHSMRLCKRCLGSRHRSSDCTSNKKCHYCREQHVSALCPERFGSRTLTSSGNAIMRNGTTRHSALTSVSDDVTALLTSKATVMRLGDDKSCQEATIMYDSGSTASFISQELVTALELVPIGKRSLEIATVSDLDPPKKQYAEYRVCIKACDNRVITVTAYGLRHMPTITSAQVLAPPDSSGMLTLSLKPCVPQIIIGQADEAKFGLRRTHLISGGGQLFETALGLAISGPLPLGTDKGTATIATPLLVEVTTKPLATAEVSASCRKLMASVVTQSDSVTLVPNRHESSCQAVRPEFHLKPQMANVRARHESATLHIEYANGTPSGGPACTSCTPQQNYTIGNLQTRHRDLHTESIPDITYSKGVETLLQVMNTCALTSHGESNDVTTALEPYTCRYRNEASVPRVPAATVDNETALSNVISHSVAHETICSPSETVNAYVTTLDESEILPAAPTSLEAILSKAGGDGLDGAIQPVERTDVLDIIQAVYLGEMSSHDILPDLCQVVVQTHEFEFTIHNVKRDVEADPSSFNGKCILLISKKLLPRDKNAKGAIQTPTMEFIPCKSIAVQLEVIDKLGASAYEILISLAIGYDTELSGVYPTRINADSNVSTMSWYSDGPSYRITISCQQRYCATARGYTVAIRIICCIYCCKWREVWRTPNTDELAIEQAPPFEVRQGLPIQYRAEPSFDHTRSDVTAERYECIRAYDVVEVSGLPLATHSESQVSGTNFLPERSCSDPLGKVRCEVLSALRAQRSNQFTGCLTSCSCSSCKPFGRTHALELQGGLTDETHEMSYSNSNQPFERYEVLLCVSNFETSNACDTCSSVLSILETNTVRGMDKPKWLWSFISACNVCCRIPECVSDVNADHCITSCTHTAPSSDYHTGRYTTVRFSGRQTDDYDDDAMQRHA